MLGDDVADLKPDFDCDLGLSFGTTFLRDADLSGASVDEHARQLEQDASDAEIKYAISALGAPSLRQHPLRQRRKCGQAPDLADIRMRKVAFTLAKTLQSWRAVVLCPGRAAICSGPAWKLLRAEGTWSKTTAHAANRCSRSAALSGLSSKKRRRAGHATFSPSFVVHLRGMRLRRRDLRYELKVVNSKDGDSITGAKQMHTRIIIDVALHIVKDDLLMEYPGEPTVTTDGLVTRHRARGGPVFDAKEAKRQEDAHALAGMKDPGLLHDRWPQLWAAMEPIGCVIEHARDVWPELRNIASAVGPEPARPPPSVEVIKAVREQIGLALGLDAHAVDRHHSASPWRFSLVCAIQQRARDPDVHLAAWLEEGAPMGIKRITEPSNGIFPAAPADAVISPEDVHNIPYIGNHPSYKETGAAQELIEEHLNAGFGLLFWDRQSAECYLGERIAPAPLGCISKVREDGTVKHRGIQDLRRNAVNDAAALPERQVLPTPFSHANDLAILAAAAADDPQVQLDTLVLDFKDAFMGIPLHPAEMPYNCCFLEKPVKRSRAQIIDHEPEEGYVIVWRVLGFGGRPNPLVFGRAASFASRSAQALLRPTASAKGSPRAGLGRLQTYVDDPVLTTIGTDDERMLAKDLVLIWWLALGLPLAWSKGCLTSGPHRWIGAMYETLPIELAPAHLQQAGLKVKTITIISLPEDFAATLASDLLPLAAGKGALPTRQIDRTLGRAGRLAYIIPSARPFVTALWAALQAANDSAPGRRRGAPLGMVPAKRFAKASCLAPCSSSATSS